MKSSTFAQDSPGPGDGAVAALITSITRLRKQLQIAKGHCLKLGLTDLWLEYEQQDEYFASTAKQVAAWDMNRRVSEAKSRLMHTIDGGRK